MRRAVDWQCRGWASWAGVPARAASARTKAQRSEVILQMRQGAGDLVGRCLEPLCFSLLSLASISLRWQAASRLSSSLYELLLCLLCLLSYSIPAREAFYLHSAGVDSGAQWRGHLSS